MAMYERRRRNGSVATLAAFAILLLIASTASASSERTEPQKFDLVNGCNGEHIPYEGQLHTVMNNQMTGSSMHLNMLIQKNGKGTGLDTGAQYNVGDQFKTNMIIKMPAGAGNMLFRQWEKATATGSTLGVDFWLLEKIYVHPDGSDGGTSTDPPRCHPEQP